MFAVCYNCGTRQTLNFAVCFYFCRVFIGRAHGIRARLPCVYPLPCVRKPGTRQTWALPCVGSFAACCLFGTWQRLRLPCARYVAHGKDRLCRRLNTVCRLPCAAHGKNFTVCISAFAVCFGTRQTNGFL